MRDARFAFQDGDQLRHRADSEAVPAVVTSAAIEGMRDKLATVIVNGELALAMDGDAARERLTRLLAAAWAIDALLRGAGPEMSAPATGTA
jgi:hypothetical protein